MAADMKNFQFTVPMPADSTASSYPRYVQLAFPNGMMFVFETFTATPEDSSKRLPPPQKTGPRYSP
uniref:Uncharacterized protein n=1 Tax=Romanomermis culicivorax TaxID=13658 RepID=A0A915J0N3_ROMCU